MKLHVQGTNFAGKKAQLGGKSFKKLNSTEFMEFVFSKSDAEWCWALILANIGAASGKLHIGGDCILYSVFQVSTKDVQT